MGKDNLTFLEPLLQAIRQKESNNRYDVSNEWGSGAYGAYQIMPELWSPWGKEAGLPANFPKTPANQDTIARDRFSKMLEDWDGDPKKAAMEWYAGPNAPSWSYQSRNNPQGQGDSVNDYANKVYSLMGMGWDARDVGDKF